MTPRAIAALRVRQGQCRHCGGPVPCWSELGDRAVGKKHTTASWFQQKRERARANRVPESEEGGIPTSTKPCAACSGSGSLRSYDIAAMKQAREAAGLSQSALARAAGWQAGMVSGLESGSRPMTKASAERYWKALHGGKP